MINHGSDYYGIFAPLKNDSVMDNKGYAQIKAVRHIAMGIILWVFAAVMFKEKAFGAFDLSAGLAYSLGSVLVLYGAFRIWRGIADIRMLKQEE